MRQNNELLKKREMLETFDKIIDLKIFKLVTKIKVLEKQVGSVVKTFNKINEFRKRIGQESNFFESYIVDREKQVTKNNKKSNAYIYLQTNDDSQIAKYSDFKIWEHINTQVQTKDLVYIVGKRLFDIVDQKIKKSVILKSDNLLFLSDYTTGVGKDFEEYSHIFKNISNLSLNLYEDMVAEKITIIYSDIKNTSNLFELDILPLNFAKNTNIYNKNKQNMQLDYHHSNTIKYDNPFEKNITEILTFVTNKKHPIKFSSDLYLVNRTILKMLISFSIKYIIFAYLLNMMLRQMYTLEDNKKSIDKNKEKINQAIHKQRQEYITREMILTASTLKSIRKNQKEFVEKRKKEGFNE